MRSFPFFVLFVFGKRLRHVCKGHRPLYSCKKLKIHHPKSINPIFMSNPISKTWLTLPALLLTFLLGIWAAHWYFSKTETTEKTSATVILEQVKEVAKLVTVEGQFAEIYDYEDFYGYDLPLFRKKALVRVQAKVLVGYDLEKMKITSEPEKKLIRISEVPPAELLAIEHDLDYYDIQEGIFNSFTADDYNKVNAAAKDFIRKKAQESELFDVAREQRGNLFEMMRFMVESAGWKLVIENGDGAEGERLPD